MNTLIFQRLQKMMDQQKLHHGFFFVGGGEATHQQKVETAQAMAAYFFASQDATLNQAQWQKRIADKNHPDFFHLFSPDQEVKRDQIQELIRWVMVSPSQGTQKFAMIEHAGRMNLSAANALLKTLEEPPAHATLLLLAPSRDSVLQTLRSRMFTIVFPQETAVDDAQDAPSWMPQLQKMLTTEQFSPKAVFDFSVEASKERGDLRYFFHAVEKHLLMRMQQTQSSRHFTQYESLFDQAIYLENDLYRRYGNISLGLETFLLQWGQS